MTERMLIDTGPLVAIQSLRDTCHEICVQQLRSLQPPLLTTWPVLTEAAWLLRRDLSAVSRMLSGVQGGLVEIFPLGEDAPAWIADFLTKYQDVRPDLADASLMYVAQHVDAKSIFTLDVRDFSIYRLASGQALQIFPDLAQGRPA